VGPVHALQWEVDGKGWPVTYTGHAALAAAANHTSGNGTFRSLQGGGPWWTVDVLTMAPEVGGRGGGARWEVGETGHLPVGHRAERAAVHHGRAV